MISRMGPRSPPRRCISSVRFQSVLVHDAYVQHQAQRVSIPMITSATCRTYDRVCQDLEIPSHFSGVVMMMSASRMVLVSGVLSPVSSTSFKPICLVNLLRQSCTRSRTSAFMGAMYCNCPQVSMRSTELLAWGQDLGDVHKLVCITD